MSLRGDHKQDGQSIMAARPGTSPIYNEAGPSPYDHSASEDPLLNSSLTSDSTDKKANGCVPPSMGSTGPATEQKQDKQFDPTSEPLSERQLVAEEAYSVFSVGQKKLIILTGSLAGFFSPLSSSIYFPALNTIANDLHVSSTQINLSVTTYLVRLPSSSQVVRS